MNDVPIYPNGVIPGLLGQLHDRYGDTPKDAALLGSCLHGAGAIAASGVARCRRDDDGEEMVINGVHAPVAGSGTGKSVHYRRATNPIKAWEQKQHESTREEKVHKEVEGHAWDSRFGAVKKKIGHEHVNGGDAEAYKQELLKLICNKPEEDAESALMQSDSTSQALVHAFKRFPVGALATSEGGSIFERMRPGDFPLINSMLDGETVTHSRVKTGTMKIHPNFSILLPVQNETFVDFLAQHGTKYETSGLGPRSHYAYVSPAWIGTEIIREETDADRDLIRRYATRVHELLDTMVANVRRGMTGLPVKELSPKAKAHLGQLRRQNRELIESGEYAVCSRFIAKQGDHVTRMAALWHVFEGREGDVSCEYVEAAAEILQYHLDVYRLLHAKPPRERQEANDADLLLGVLQDAIRYGRPPTRPELMNLALNAGISSASRFGNALGLLGSEKKVEVSRTGRVHLVLPNQPQHAPDTARRIAGPIRRAMAGRFDAM
ncbi:DUF3987 domain-containing protein [Paraburkholderia saeva]|uniref:DUF3987 domain-containing protein n=1 Tax=Paraburkholderia saeva TaxID=2777537 RepID=UPI001D944C21|nr:DUF3987 domain-containing protein [Paraburkholderia saeva]CAG4910208.1 hypothetical protein R52603_03801 [Paraburkholderia saeva]